jgi:hypothetical protein
MCDTMAKNITLSISDSIYALIKAHPEINWSNIAKRGIEAFATILTRAETAEEEIKKSYGNDTAARMSFGINENSNQNRNPMEDGMIGMNYNSGVDFSVTVQPTRQGRVPQTKKVLEDLTKK